MLGERVRKVLWYGAWAVALLWAARTTVLPARLRGPRLTGVLGAGPFYAQLGWDYGPGARPQSVIFDFEAGAARGSCTTDGEAVEAEIPIGVRPHGSYSLTVSATYRVLGFARTVVTRGAGAA